MMFSVTTGVCHIYIFFISRRLTHQWITEPFFPDFLAYFCLEHVDDARFRVEDNISALDHRGRGSIITSSIYPPDVTFLAIDRVKLITPIPPADKYQTIVTCYSGQRTVAWYVQFPSFVARLGIDYFGVK